MDELSQEGGRCGISKGAGGHGAVQGYSQYYISYHRTLDEVTAAESYTESGRVPGRRAARHIEDKQEAVWSDAPIFH